MKREHFSDSYIDWLKSLGCVFYAPMLEEGDLKDYISGEILVPTSGTVTWDNNLNAYKFVGPPSNQQYIAHWTNLLLDIDITNVEFSILDELYIVSVTTCPLIFGNRTSALNCQGCPTNQWIKWATSWPAYDGVNQKINYIYLNGNRNPDFPNGVNRGTGYTTWNVAAIQSIECNPTGSLSQYRNKTYYMRNAMIFNKALSQVQIKEIQQI